MKRIFPALLAMAAFGQVKYEDILKGPGSDWLTYSGDYAAHRNSPLKQITVANAHNLSAKWVYHVDKSTHLECVPLVKNGIMYVTNSNEVHALDAKTGRKIWKYRDDAVKRSDVNRGVALLNDKVYFVTSDAHLVALNAITGALVWNTQYADTKLGYSATMAPMAVKDKILVGVSGGDSGMRGFVAAFHAEAGTEVWRTWTVPKRGEPGSETWGDLTIDWGGAGTWLSGTFDPALNTIYWTTGNPWPDFSAYDRNGDNLYSDSLLALDADTGKMKWHFQFTPKDVWDWDAQSWPVLIDMPWEGKPRKLVFHANRNGYFYVLDRTNGQFLRATKFGDFVDWAEGIDPKSGRPIVKKEKIPTAAGIVACPSIRGVTNWMSPSFNSALGLYFIPCLEQCDTFTSSNKKPEAMKGFAGTGVETIPNKPGKFYMRAFDPKSGKKVWEYPMTGKGESWAGTVSTAAGVLFYGDDDGQFVALEAKTGRHLWHFNTGQLLTASPITYAVDGKQYVTIATATDVMTFGLFEPAVSVPQVKEVTQ